jgi:thiamine pyrophosphokinase
MFLIVSGGEAPGSAFVRERAEMARKVIAADSGARYCLEAGVTPDLVVGDMDSLPDKLHTQIREAGIPLKIHPPMKDETDTRLALEEAISLGARKVEIIAATGDRFDHSLANLHLLYSAHLRKVDACIHSPGCRIFLVEGGAVIRGVKGATISLLPLTMEAGGITLAGFQWPLTDAVMKLGDPYGISNVVCSDEARIEVRAGILIVTILEARPGSGDKG